MRHRPALENGQRGQRTAPRRPEPPADCGESRTALAGLGRLRVGALLLLALVAAALLFAALRDSRPAAAAAELRVCNTTTGFIPTIQAAVDAAQAGDTIKVAAGVVTQTKS